MALNERCLRFLDGIFQQPTGYGFQLAREEIQSNAHDDYELFSRTN
jgi:hypothetical protein